MSVKAAQHYRRREPRQTSPLTSLVASGNLVSGIATGSSSYCRVRWESCRNAAAPGPGAGLVALPPPPHAVNPAASTAQTASSSSPLHQREWRRFICGQGKACRRRNPPTIAPKYQGPLQRAALSPCDTKEARDGIEPSNGGFAVLGRDLRPLPTSSNLAHRDELDR